MDDQNLFYQEREPQNSKASFTNPQAETAFFTGLFSLFSLFLIPFISIILSLIAIGYARKSVRDNVMCNKARIGLGLAVLSLVLLAVLIAVVIYYLSDPVNYNRLLDALYK